MAQLTASKMAEMLSTVGQLSKSKGLFVARRGFFYTHGYTAEKFAASVKAELAKQGVEINVVETGEVWKPFKGSASVAQSSHWFVKFTVK